MPNIEKRIHVVVGVVILVSLLPPLFAWLRSRRTAGPLNVIGRTETASPVFGCLCPFKRATLP